MRGWFERPPDEAALLNPSFVASLHWSSANAFSTELANATPQPFPLGLAFVAPAFVLHRPTREKLPRQVRTSLAVWLDEEPILRSQIPQRASRG